MKTNLVIVLTLILIVGFFVWAYNNNAWSETSEFQLEELEPGAYCLYRRIILICLKL